MNTKLWLCLKESFEIAGGKSWCAVKYYAVWHTQGNERKFGKANENRGLSGLSCCGRSGFFDMKYRQFVSNKTKIFSNIDISK